MRSIFIGRDCARAYPRNYDLVQRDVNDLALVPLGSILHIHDSAPSRPLSNIQADAALRAILEGTATETGERFFFAVVQHLAKALGTHGAWVTEYFPDTRRLRALAFWMDGQWVNDYEVDIAGTPCGRVIDTAQLVHFPDRILEIYPHEEELRAAGAVSYLGVPLMNTDGSILGHMAVIDRRPLPEESQIHAIFRLFAARAAAELQRLRAEAEVRNGKKKSRGCSAAPWMPSLNETTIL